MIDKVDTGGGLRGLEDLYMIDTTWLIQVGLEDLYMIDTTWLMLT
jgi:hypothetical protein